MGQPRCQTRSGFSISRNLEWNPLNMRLALHRWKSFVFVVLKFTDLLVHRCVAEQKHELFDVDAYKSATTVYAIIHSLVTAP